MAPAPPCVRQTTGSWPRGSPPPGPRAVAVPRPVPAGAGGAVAGRFAVEHESGERVVAVDATKQRRRAVVWHLGRGVHGRGRRSDRLGELVGAHAEQRGAERQLVCVDLFVGIARWRYGDLSHRFLVPSDRAELVDGRCADGRRRQCDP